MVRIFMIREVVRMLHGTTSMSGFELARGVSINSKNTRNGDLFFALKGEHTDGHQYVAEALMNGACAVVVKKGTRHKQEILVSDTLYALGQFARHYRSLFHPRTIAITGTNGKTTVKNLISAILRTRFRVLSTRRNLNSLIGLPLTIIELSGNEDYLVVEMGTSSPGEIPRLCEIAMPDIGIITNIGPGHLEGLGSLEGVRQEKLSLVQALPDSGFAVLGEGIDSVTRENTYRFSMDMLTDIQLTEYGSRFVYNGHLFFTPLVGMGNVANCLAALVVTERLGIDKAAQASALNSVLPEPGRLEPLHYDGLFIVNDSYNANPVSMKEAIDFMSTIPRRKIFVLGDMLELGKQSQALHRKIGTYAREHCDLLLTAGEKAVEYGGRHYKDARQLVHFVLETLEGDEAVLIKASRALQFEHIVNGVLRGLRG